MRRQDAISLLSLQADNLKARGATAAFLFGSTARDEATRDSDIDLFIDIEPGRKFSLLDLAGIKRLLSEKLGVDIDVTTRASLHPKLRQEIERGALQIY
jgi:predicted nucleotidyltransferase